ncbi:hypothetical protein FFI16_020445 [Pseudomonas sp. KBS0710]|uniref:hypothetical protein n=1 Tax=Pseudomonas sp. KBS0710 TaxID=1179667 RepID=UPI00110E7A54|nr:hypothetical protein [Pseudomonas sp. KBS0710]TSD78691.1 hypothetical protein FFI16_020445 [Pseudomonas sp. KBS0710]
MHTLHLPPSARGRLSQQITQNGVFVHTLLDSNGVGCATASVAIEQCERAVSMSVALGDSVNTITLAVRKDTGLRAVRFLEDLISGVSVSTVPEVDEYLLVSDLEFVLREAVRLQQGTYELPVEEIENLWLMLRPSVCEPTRTVFHFELDSVGITLPLRLPNSRDQAYELLSACVREFIATYRRER